MFPDPFPSEANLWDPPWDIFETTSLILHMRQLRVREGSQSHTGAVDECGTQASPVFTLGLLCTQGMVGRTDSHLWREPLRAPDPQTLQAALPPGTRLCSSPTPFFKEVVEAIPSRNQGEMCLFVHEELVS